MSAIGTLRSARPAPAIVLGAAAIVVAAGLGMLSAGPVWIALAAGAGILGVAVLLRDPVLLPVLAVPATWVQVRLGNLLSVADVVLGAATVLAVVLVLRRGVSPVRPLLWAGVCYLALAVPTLVLNVYPANLVEWLHEVFLVLGSLLVGYVIGRRDRARLALTVYAVVCGAFAILAVAVTAVGYARTGTLDAAYVLTLQKNTTGGMLLVSGVLAFARPAWLRWSRVFAWVVLGLSVAGILAAQSRQALIGLVIGVVVVSLRARPETGRRARAVWIAAVPAVALVGVVLAQQLSSGDRFNSAFQRVDWYQQSFEIWKLSPVFGVGMRWWYTDRFSAQYQAFQPPNAELEVLTEVGVVGLIGFLAMFVAGFWLLWRMDPIYGTVGAAVVAARFTQAQFDLYWVSGQASLLWIVAGICVGVQALDRERAAAGLVPAWGPALIDDLRRPHRGRLPAAGL